MCWPECGFIHPFGGSTLNKYPADPGPIKHPMTMDGWRTSCAWSSTPPPEPLCFLWRQPLVLLLLFVWKRTTRTRNKASRNSCPFLVFTPRIVCWVLLELLVLVDVLHLLLLLLPLNPPLNGVHLYARGNKSNSCFPFCFYRQSN